jgi:nucleoside-diphosphate-sugar epimerase
VNVLFIGGTGTISSACAKVCVDQGIDLTLLLRGTRDHRVPDKATVIHGDIKQYPAQVRDLLGMREWDCVVDWVAYDEQDVMRDVELFRGRTKRFFFISSTSAYQKPLPSPWVTESTPIGNRYWSYADKKARCERLFLKYRDSEGFPVVIVRPGAVYAEFTLPTGIAGWGYGLVKRLREGKPVLVHGDGTGWWTLTFNEDFAGAFVPLLGLESVAGETIHIVSGEVHSWLQIYDMIGETFGMAPSYVFASADLIGRYDAELGATLLGDKSHSYWFDISRLRTFVPSFTARVSLRQGLQRCRDWFVEHERDIKVDPSKDRLLDAIVEDIRCLEARSSGTVPVR